MLSYTPTFDAGLLGRLPYAARDLAQCPELHAQVAAAADDEVRVIERLVI